MNEEWKENERKRSVCVCVRIIFGILQMRSSNMFLEPDVKIH
jgi:hypothetical protein